MPFRAFKRIAIAGLPAFMLAVMPAFAHAQTSIYDGLKPGDAQLTATAPALAAAVTSVRLDVVCDAARDGGLELILEDALALQGVQVDKAAAYTLRVETSPCESAFRRRENPAMRDAFEGSARAPELRAPARPFDIPFGRDKLKGARLSMNMLLFRSGQAPIWNAIVAARAPGKDMQAYFDEMVQGAIAQLQQASQRSFVLANAATGTP